MKLWRWLLLLLLVAALASWGWHWIAADPGYVLIQIRGWRVQTSLLVVVVALLLLWAVLGLAGRILRWPFGAVSRGRRRLGHRRLSAGLVGLVEGRHARAERKLRWAGHYKALRAPARLLQADAARSRGAWDRALEHLDKAGDDAPGAVLVLRARVLRERGEPQQAVELLEPQAEDGSLPPQGWHELVLARLDAADAPGALQALAPLRKSGALDKRSMAHLEDRVLRAALGSSVDAEALSELWHSLPRARRSDPELLAVYARQAARDGSSLSVMNDLKSTLRKHWDSDLAAMYVSLDAAAPERRLQQGEKWLKKHPDDALLLAAVGVVCAQQGIDGKARDYLQRAIELDADLAPAWTALGDVARDEGDEGTAAHCYRNALGVSLGDNPSVLLPGRSHSTPTVAEERDQYGVPRMPGGDFAADD